MLEVVGVGDVLQLQGGQVEHEAVVGSLYLPTHRPQHLGQLLAVHGRGLVSLQSDNSAEEVTSADLGVGGIKGDSLDQAGTFYIGQTINVGNLFMINELIFLLGYFQLPVDDIISVDESVLHREHALNLLLLGAPQCRRQGVAGRRVEGDPLPPPPALLAAHPHVEVAEAGVVGDLEVDVRPPCAGVLVAHVKQRVDMIRQLRPPGSADVQLLHRLLVILDHLAAHFRHDAGLPVVQQTFLQDTLLGLGQTQS